MVAATENGKKVVRQVEYYFGDLNLQRDTFLMDEMKKDEGWISLDTMMKFKRLAEIVDNKKEGVTAALESIGTDLIEVSEDKTKIRRVTSKPIPVYDDNYKRLQKNRTAAVKGLGKDETLDKLQDFFEPYGSESIYMMRNRETSEFKGTAFVTFKTQEDMDKFMAEAETKYNDVVLEKQSKQNYYDSKSGKEKKPEKKAREEDTDAVNRVIKFTGVTDDTVGREEIIEALKGSVDFTCFERGNTEGICLLNQGESAATIVGALEKNPVKIRSAEEVKFEALEGEVAEGAVKKLKDEREALFARLKSRGGGKGRGRGRGGFGGRGERKPKNTKTTFNDDDEPVAKKAKAEGE
ncbi:Oidioi.mRNA.OKI2018_I69.PAR.g11708.t1.cds [Oikopleura dioica]|uniref:Oidioi.mRNA.OKI2018_I69.PAR.g11708.t1.cds n=1 Tax=Oikopleura dioica TaxID=34765 RepID=A0ABN7RZY6_OIKDI|nr:Oidioi.mRNA.OKI2018_I69.PAR.g11708.t1.cds [Oikopleura dioica]